MFAVMETYVVLVVIVNAVDIVKDVCRTLFFKTTVTTDVCMVSETFVHGVFCSVDIRHYVSKSSKNRTNVNVFGYHVFGRDNSNFFTVDC